MPDAPWKRHEREVAEAVGGERQGGAPGHPWPDVISPKLVIECKYRQALPKWLKEAVKQARIAKYAEGYKHANKLPAVALKEKGMHGFYVVMHSQDWLDWFGEMEVGDD